MVYLHTGPMGVHRACFFIARAGRAATPERNRSGNQPPILCILPLVAHQLASAREKLATAAWYLHSNRDGKLFFKNVENLYAKLESLANSYVGEQPLKELRKRLEEMFEPTNRWCYQRVQALPA